MSDECIHTDDIREVIPSALGCEECLKIGSPWVHLRLCRTCGNVRCCDDSPNRHATKHFHATRHPIIEGYDPPEGWGWCYIDEIMLDLSIAPPRTTARSRAFTELAAQTGSRRCAVRNGKLRSNRGAIASQANRLLAKPSDSAGTPQRCSGLNGRPVSWRARLWKGSRSLLSCRRASIPCSRTHSRSPHHP
jgi:hypothetical protein